MVDFPPTVIWRHRKENLKKCSLRGLEPRKDLHFVTYPTQPLPPLEEYLQLDFDGPPLNADDAGRGIFLIDGTWKAAAVMGRKAPELEKRSLPANFLTAYPRKQTKCLEPERGLATLEALYIAHLALGYNVEGLLDYFYWKDEFLAMNEKELAYISTPLQSAQTRSSQ